MTFTVEVEGMPIPEVKWYVFNKVWWSANSDIIAITINITIPVLLYKLHLWLVRLKVWILWHETKKHQATCYISNTVDLYSGDIQFESYLKHWLSWQVFSFSPQWKELFLRGHYLYAYFLTTKCLFPSGIYKWSLFYSLSLIQANSVFLRMWVGVFTPPLLP